jgi:hypothetical protein
VAALANAVKAANTARILVIDIERLAGLTYRFDQAGSTFIPVSRWKQLPAPLCFASKWIGQKRLEFHAAWDDPAAMVQRSWELYDQADIVVTYNGVKFDNKHLRSEWLLAGLPPPRPWKNVDLYTVNRAKFGFESKSLQHLCDRLGLPGKSGHYDPAMAERCMDGDLRSQMLMARYNRGDVRITEAVYWRLLPYIHNHPHVITLSGDEMRCNKCGSDDVAATPTPYRADKLEYPQFRCNKCQGLFRSGSHSRRFARTQGVQ